MVLPRWRRFDILGMMTDSVSELMQQAIAQHGRGALDDASRLYNHVLGREPENSDALHLLGVVAHQQGRNEDAVALISRAIDRRPRAPAFRNNLGMALTALGRTTEAELAYREALALAPDFADAMLNLGNLQARQGQLEEALNLLERAVALDPDAPEGHYNLGWARFTVGDHRGALDALKRALDLGADFAEVHYRIGSVHVSLGNLSDAVDCFRRALDRDGHHLGAQHGLLECLDLFPADTDVAQLEQVVGPLLRATSVNPRSFGHTSARWLERKYRLRADDGSAESAEQLGNRLLDDELARLYLQRTINVSVPLERLLGRCRAQWLERSRESVAIAPSRWSAVGAVAIQCFLNEFVWMVTPEEAQTVEYLERHITRSVASKTVLDEKLVSDLLVYACYRPLWRLEGAGRLGAAPANDFAIRLRDFLRVCIHEPLRERELRTRVASGVDIRDDVSRAVRAQYEESPYPRWLTITLGDTEDVEQRVQRWCPNYVAPAALSGPLRVLVAGCGTGMDAIDFALHLKNAEVTAVDLSRASLAYAMRKAEEYRLENIRFRQEDILAIDRDVDAYHVINCTGVLHHMRDPSAGLARLVELLVPGGLIKLALYSRLAREPLSKAREIIHTAGLGPREDDIRAFRCRVLEEGENGALAELMGSTDFFTLSECRDLLFHVHEVHFDLPGVRRLLEQSGLEFLGLELPISQVEEGFRRENPDADLTDLEAWEAYEHRHPESFRSMYRFWCKKPGD